MIDEAHRLRNVYQPNKIVANTIKDVLSDRRKLLYGDAAPELAAGALRAGQHHRRTRVRRSAELPRQFIGPAQARTFDALKARLQPLCTRTLRARCAATSPTRTGCRSCRSSRPSDPRTTLYDLVSEYLRRPNLQALPAASAR